MKLRSLAALATLVFFGACSKKTVVTTTITAAAGGTVTVDNASLAIPAGSLSADTEITVEVTSSTEGLPNAESIHGKVYDFGPDGTTFDPPATLALPLEGTPAEGQWATIAWLDTTKNAWENLASTVENGKVTALVSHFTTFAVRFAGTTALDCGFTACGGDPVGAWNIDGFCADFQQEGFEGCPTATIDVEMDMTGTLDVNSDYTLTIATSGTQRMTVTIPASCLPQTTDEDTGVTCSESVTCAEGTGCNFDTGTCWQEVALTSCTQMDTMFGDGPDAPDVTCSGDKTVSCACVATENQSNDSGANSTGTWSVSGNNITITDDPRITDMACQNNEQCTMYGYASCNENNFCVEVEDPSVMLFCRNGDTLRIQGEDGPEGSAFTIIMSK